MIGNLDCQVTALIWKELVDLLLGVEWDEGQAGARGKAQLARGGLHCILPWHSGETSAFRFISFHHVKSGFLEKN